MSHEKTTIVRTAEGLQELTQRLLGCTAPFGYDSEYSGPSIVWRKKSRPDMYRAQLTGFSISIGDAKWYVPVDHAEGGNVLRGAAEGFLSWLVVFMEHCSPRRVWAHNWKADLQVLKNFGVAISPFSDHLHDSIVVAWLAGWGADHASLKLKKLAEELGFGAGDTYDEMAKKRAARDIPVEEMAPYAGRDAWLTVQIGELGWKRLEEFDLVDHYRRVDVPLIEVIRAMEEWGTPTDVAELEKMRAELVREAAELATEFKELTTTTVLIPVNERVDSGEVYKNGNPKLKTVEVMREFTLGANVSNDHQVSRWCYEELKVWPLKIRKVKGGPLTKIERTKAHHYPVGKEFLEQWTILPNELGARLAVIRLEHAWRTKLIGTYLDPMLRLPEQYGDGRLHCSFNLTGTETQRFSSSGPNLQNVPSRTEHGKRLRRALVAPPGWKIIVLDYSQVELRIAAHLSQDEAMLAAYIFEEDIHQQTLDAMLKFWSGASRGDAKTNNFSTIYRISPPSLAIKIRNTEEAAEKSIEAFYVRYPGISRYHRQAIAFAAKRGYAQTTDGFKRFLDVTPKMNRWSKKMEMPWAIANQAINTPIQGSAGGIIKIAMRDIHRAWVADGVWGDLAILTAQEHDSLIAMAREDYADEALVLMKQKMESAFVLRVPLVADGGKGDSWADAKG